MIPATMLTSVRKIPAPLFSRTALLFLVVAEGDAELPVELPVPVELLVELLIALAWERLINHRQQGDFDIPGIGQRSYPQSG